MFNYLSFILAGMAGFGPAHYRFKAGGLTAWRHPRMERVTGFEPALPAWRAGVLPLNYTRVKMEEGDIAVHAPPGVEPGDKRTRTTLAHLRGTVPRGLHCAELRGKGIGVPRKLRTYLLPIYRSPHA